MEDILSIILYIAAFCVVFLMGGVYGWNLRERFAARVLERLVTKVEEESKPDYIKVVIEKHNDVFYVYNKETNQFMGQGSSKEELEDLLHKNFPGKRFGASEENLAEVGFLS
jgi:hypothetical protein